MQIERLGNRYEWIIVLWWHEL